MTHILLDFLNGYIYPSHSEPSYTHTQYKILLVIFEKLSHYNYEMKPCMARVLNSQRVFILKVTQERERDNFIICC